MHYFRTRFKCGHLEKRLIDLELLLVPFERSQKGRIAYIADFKATVSLISVQIMSLIIDEANSYTN